MRKRNRRVCFFKKEEDTDPLSVVVNLFDVAMVFAVSLMVAMVMHMNMTEVFTDKDFTIEESRQRKHGNHHQGRQANQPLHAEPRPVGKR